MLKNNSNKVESLQVFNYGENTPVRVRVMNGQTWFVAKDVCKVLGIEKARNAVSRLEDDERGPVLVDTLGGTQRMSAVSESGLYHLVFQSRKPEAKKFRRWVTGEVLPQIRMTGGYRAELRRDESAASRGTEWHDGVNADMQAGSPGRMPVPRERSAALGAFYAELRKWVLKEDEAAVAELAGVSPGHVAEVLAGRKPGYGVLCLLVEYATGGVRDGEQGCGAAARGEERGTTRRTGGGTAPRLHGGRLRPGRNGRKRQGRPAAKGRKRHRFTGKSGRLGLPRSGSAPGGAQNGRFA